MKKPDIKLITYHMSYSYGGCLQAFASVKILEEIGCTVTVIDYENKYEARWRNGSYFKYESLKSIFVFIIKNVFFGYKYGKERAFGSFLENYPLITKKISTDDDLNMLAADEFIG